MLVMPLRGIGMARIMPAAENLVDPDQALIRAWWDQGADVHRFLPCLNLHHRALGAPVIVTPHRRSTS